MERPTRRSATAANGLSAASSSNHNHTTSSNASSSSSSRRRRRESDRAVDSGSVSDGADTDSSAVAVEMGTAARSNKAAASKKSSVRAAKTKTTDVEADVDTEAEGGDVDHTADDDADVDSEDPVHDDDLGAAAATSAKQTDDEAIDAPAVVGYATRARRERSQSVVSTASDSASSVTSTRHGADDEDMDDDDDDGTDAAPHAELHVEKLAELEKKKKMVEEGSLAEYCRRVAEFKEERNRLLQSAEWHKNLQLKNTADLYGFEVQRAHNIWQDSKERLKSDMLVRTDALLAKLRGELATLQESDRLPTHVVTPKKTFVLPLRKATPATEVSPAGTGPVAANVAPQAVVHNEEQEKDDGADADEEEEGEQETPQKRRKVVEGSAPVPVNVLRLPLDDISSDLASIMNARETASTKIHAALPVARLELRVDRRRLLCGKYVFEEGDEVVVTAAVLKEDYIGVISSVSDEELYVKLSTGQKVRVAVAHIAHRRCEIRPFLRGSAGIESLQSSGWVECEPF